MNYLLDTNILLIYGRSVSIANRIEREKGCFNGINNLAISVVTLGEIDSLTKQFNYGERRKKVLEQLISNVFIIDINVQKIIEKYGEIDAYSQGKLSLRSSRFTTRNMGKNDLWIAATAAVYDLTLVTTDKDFTHLSEEYLKLDLIDIQKYK